MYPDHNLHVQEYYYHQIKVVGPKVLKDEYYYEAAIGIFGLGDKVGFGSSPEEAKSELMTSLGY